MTADYIYNYYKAKCLTTDAYITDRKIGYNGVMKYIDTSLSSEETSFALDILNIRSWSEVIDNFNINSVVYKNLVHSDLTKTTENIMGKIDISNFSSINPNKMVGKHNKTAQMVNFRYFGFIGQLLFIKIKFNMLVIP